MVGTKEGERPMCGPSGGQRGRGGQGRDAWPEGIIASFRSEIHDRRLGSV